MNTYGSAPKNLGFVDVNINEMMFYMYLPIKFPQDKDVFMLDNLPKRLHGLNDILISIPPHEYRDKYVYVTCKHTYVTADYMANRKGWHCDGFMTDDINYIWYDSAPTEFCIQDYDMPMDDKSSLEYMEAESKRENVVTYPCKNLIRLDQFVVHRVTENPYEGMRTFIKISISDMKFNLIGNSKNYLMDYDWKMYSRDELRNMECNSDYTDESVS